MSNFNVRDIENSHCPNSEKLNLSDVLDVLQTMDPGYRECDPSAKDVRETVEAMRIQSADPRVEITEQPASGAFRFRYECESRSTRKTSQYKTFPTIRISGYNGRAIVIVSCVTKDPPYLPHPHKLVGKYGCKDGICTLQTAPDEMTVVFTNLGIQCVKRRNIKEALEVRERLRVDPFKTGFGHKNHTSNIDLKVVRLCFQVFLENPQNGKFNIALSPVLSDPIYDKKVAPDLVICKLSTCAVSVAGGTEMILLCEKVSKDDIQVRFFEERDGDIVWEGFGYFPSVYVHKNVAIIVRTPSYPNQEIDLPVQIFVQLVKPSNGATSEPVEIQMLPLDADDAGSLRRKRKKFANSSSAFLLKRIQAEAESHYKNVDLLKPEQGGWQFSCYGPPHGSPAYERS